MWFQVSVAGQVDREHVPSGCPVRRTTCYRSMSLPGKVMEHLSLEVTVMETLDEATTTITVTSITASEQGLPDPGRSRPDPAGSG